MKTFRVKPLSKAALESISRDILLRFDPEALNAPKKLDVESLIDTFLMSSFGWSLDVQTDLPPDILGISDPKNQSIRLSEDTYQRILAGDGRARFTGCHEFGHVALHRGEMTERMITFGESNEMLFRNATSSLRAFENPEWQADYLAGALLMPKNAVQILTQTNRMNRVSAMVASFGVSIQAAEVRLKKLGLYTI